MGENGHKARFEEALTQCISESNFFKFEDEYYRQTMGLPMGLSISGTLAGWVLDDLTTTIMNRTKSRVKLIKKYVDDYFIIVHKDDVNLLLNEFNNAHHSTKFTIETEKDGGLPFLDMYIQRDGNTLTTNWYCKDVASGRLLNYLSAHPPNMLFNVGLSFAQRVIQCESHKTTQQ